MTDQTPEHDEATDPNPATIADLDSYEASHPGAPSAEELAADRNLYPEPTGDDVADGTALPDTEHGDHTAESGDHEESDS
jgi:hypothetical protein